ncbi:MAG: glycosyltransferase family 39 protein [Lapillicoccus sp.]
MTVAVTNRFVQAGLVALVELSLCLVRLRDAYDIFIDEVTYTRIASSLAQGDGLTLDGQPFNLHPPAVLALLGAATKVFGLNGDLESQLLALRPMSAVFGALACAGTYLIVERAAGKRYALAAAALLGLSPFVVLYNSEVMLEAPTQAATVALFGFLAAATWASSPTRRQWCIGLAGLFGGITVCSKETFGLVVVVVLLVLLATGWVLPRRPIAAVLAMTATGYAIYVVAVGVAMGFSSWWQAKYGGALRLIGADQQTGFNAATTHVSFLSRVVANATTNGATYALLALGSLATLGLVWRFRPWRPAWRSEATPRERVGLLVALWGLAASAYLAYAIAFGTLEAQMFYIMIFPAAAAVCVWVSGRLPSWGRLGQRACVAILLVALVAQGGAWVAVHTRPAGAYQQFLAWEPTHLPHGSVISVTEDTAQFLVQGAVLGDWHTLADLKAHKVDYVLLSTVLVDQGYGTATKSFQAVLDTHATLLFESTRQGGGSLRLYCVCTPYFTVL